jgi:hypothetical protein
MAASAAEIPLSSAFQSALGALATNMTIARRVLAGDLPLNALDTTLTEPDRECLETLLGTQGSRVLALAELLTDRRRKKLVARLPMTAAILGRRLGECWLSYLESTVIQGTSVAPADAAAFGSWILEHIELSFSEAQMIRHEHCQNDVAAGLPEFFQAASAAADVRVAECRLRLSDSVRVEQFDQGIVAALERFRTTGEVLCQQTGTTVDWVFHGLPERRGRVGITKVSRPVALLLNAARSAFEARAVLSALPDERRRSLERSLQKLVALRILTVLE